MPSPRRTIIGRPLFRAKLNRGHSILADVENDIVANKQKSKELFAQARQKINAGNWKQESFDSVGYPQLYKHNHTSLQKFKGEAVGIINRESHKRKTGNRGFVRVALAGSKARERLARMKK